MGFIQDILEWLLFEFANAWALIFTALGQTAFFIESGLSGILSAEAVETVFFFFSTLAVSLVLLKVLKKGFWVYILWKDGDPDMPLQQMVVNMILAVAVAVSFPTLYTWFTSVILWVIEKISYTLFTIVIDDVNWIAVVTALVAMGPLSTILSLIYAILLFLLYLQFIKRSAELLLLRLGFPLACVGLLDSDNGVFTTTVKTFLQAGLTTVCQLICMQLSIAVFAGAASTFTNLLYCIALASAALSIPRLLQFILLPTGGGGGMHRASGALHTVNLVRSLIAK